MFIGIGAERATRRLVSGRCSADLVLREQLATCLGSLFIGIGAERATHRLVSGRCSAELVLREQLVDLSRVVVQRNLCWESNSSTCLGSLFIGIGAERATRRLVSGRCSAELVLREQLVDLSLVVVQRNWCWESNSSTCLGSLFSGIGAERATRRLVSGRCSAELVLREQLVDLSRVVVQRNWC